MNAQEICEKHGIEHSRFCYEQGLEVIESDKCKPDCPACAVEKAYLDIFKAGFDAAILEYKTKRHDTAKSDRRM